MVAYAIAIVVPIIFGVLAFLRWPAAWSVRISNVAIAVQVGLVAAMVVLLFSAPKTFDPRCVESGTDHDDALWGVILASIPVGIFALLASIVCALLRSAPSSRIFGGVGALGLCVVTLGTGFELAFCGWN